MRPNVNPRGRESGENGRNVVVARNRKMGSCATLVEEISEMAHLTVDLVPWLVQGHRDAVGHVVRQCDSVPVLGYRDRSSRILADTRELLQLCDEQGLRSASASRLSRPRRPYRRTTFGDDGEQ